MKRFIIGILLLALVSLAGCGSAPAVPGEEEEEPVGEEEEEPIIEEPEIATFTISDLSISPTELDIGERITISAVATNNGDLAGDYNMVFKINNVAVETVDLTIDGGVSQEVDFAATVEYAAGTYSVDVNGLLGSFTVKEPPPSAEFTIIGFNQDYYDISDEWSGVVGIHYKVQNNGEVHISYYKVYFTITYDDGSQYQDWDNGLHIFVGQELPDYTALRVENKEVISVEIDDFELTACRPPDEVTSTEFTITGFDQKYYETLKEWSDYVYINYTIQNSREAYIGYCRAHIIITCDDGSQYQRQIRGQDILVGQEWTDSTSVHVSGKKVTSVELTNWGSLALAETPPIVIYEITGTAKEVDITLNNATGGTEQYSNISIPKKYLYSSFTDSFLYISAQNQGEYGTVRVTIYLNGKVFKTASSSGAYVIATASGSK